MKITLKMVLVIVIMVSVCPLLFSCSRREAPKKEEPKAPAGHQKIVEEYRKGFEESKKHVAAKVNGVDITMYALIAEMNRIAPKYIKPGQKRDAETDSKVKKEALNNLIFRELAIQEAARRGIAMTPEMIDDTVKKVKANLASEEAYRKYLQDSGLTDEALRKEIERSYRFETITDKEVYGKIKVSEETLRDTYEKEKALLMTNENPPRQMTFDEAKGLIERGIKAEKGQAMIAAWDKDLRKHAKVEVLLDELEKRLREEGAKRQKK